MSKKVIKWLIADLVFIIIFTLLFLLLKNGVVSAITNKAVRSSANILLWVIYAGMDLFVLVWFLIYWWCDRKWTHIRHWGTKKINVLSEKYLRR